MSYWNGSNRKPLGAMVRAMFYVKGLLNSAVVGKG